MEVNLTSSLSLLGSIMLGLIWPITKYYALISYLNLIINKKKMSYFYDGRHGSQFIKKDGNCF